MFIPLTVPNQQHERFTSHFKALTGPSQRLLLFHDDAHAPSEELLALADNCQGAILTTLGRLARHGSGHTAPFICILNPRGAMVADIVAFAQRSKLTIAGVCVELSLLSKHERMQRGFIEKVMLQAHAAGLIFVVHAIHHTTRVPSIREGHLIADAAGNGKQAGGDFVITAPPKGDTPAQQAQTLRAAVAAGDNTGVMCQSVEGATSEELLNAIKAHVSIGGARGALIPGSLALTMAQSDKNFADTLEIAVH